ncbi:MAG TPA: alkaline phosphatase PhoX [Flavipsychrobacter sp.]|nr:alkaline phosphatase PhoX [Flavipsychrobacter sp.]
MKIRFAVILVGGSSVAFAQLPFTPVDTSYYTQTVVIPAIPFKYNVLFEGKMDTVYTATSFALAKQTQDYIGFYPLGNGDDSALLVVNHEITSLRDSVLGDGGGMTCFKIVKTNNDWNAVPDANGKTYHNVDFSGVGGTNINCGGGTTPYGKFLTAEEFPVNSNTLLHLSGSGFQDTSDYLILPGNGSYSGRTLKKYQQMGWITQIDAITAQAEKKFYGMGRFAHEAALCMDDGKTVYLTEDATPGFFYKFIADHVNDYTSGQLYAYQQGMNGIGGSWIVLPMDLDSLIVINTIALRKGATGFSRLEWMKKANGKIYFSESGHDVGDYKTAWQYGMPAAHHIRLDTVYGTTQDSILSDYYGRVLEFDTFTHTLRSYLEGGFSSDGKTVFSNPDCLTAVIQNGTTYLVIHEDIIGTGFGRSPSGNTICEVFYLDLGITNPVVDDLHRFMVGPIDAETTGGCFSPDGKTYFVNIQHPSPNNIPPFNNTVTLAVSGFNLLTQVPAVRSIGSKITVYPNPANRILYLSEKTDADLYNTEGQQVLSAKNLSRIDVAGLTPGSYFLKMADGEVIKIVVE